MSQLKPIHTVTVSFFSCKLLYVFQNSVSNIIQHGHTYRISMPPNLIWIRGLSFRDVFRRHGPFHPPFPPVECNILCRANSFPDVTWVARSGRNVHIICNIQMLTDLLSSTPVQTRFHITVSFMIFVYEDPIFLLPVTIKRTLGPDFDFRPDLLQNTPSYYSKNIE